MSDADSIAEGVAAEVARAEAQLSAIRSASVASRRQALTPIELLNNALERGVDIASMEKLMEMQERWQRNEARKAFDGAMSAAKSRIPTIRKTNEVDFTTAKGRTNYRYEDLASIAAVINPILAEQGLSYRFRTSSNPNEPVSVTCIISHELGHAEENTLSAGRDETGNKNNIQAVGSTVTYLQRYTLKAALGLAAAPDDDAQSASARPADKIVNPKTSRLVDPNSSAQLKRSGAWDSFVDRLQGFQDARDIDGLREWFASDATCERIAKWPQAWREKAHEEFEAAFERIKALEAAVTLR